jgi:hypothetical protein
VSPSLVETSMKFRYAFKNEVIVVVVFFFFKLDRSNAKAMND